MATILGILILALILFGALHHIAFEADDTLKMPLIIIVVAFVVLLILSGLWGL